MKNYNKESESFVPRIFRDQDKYYVGYLEPNHTEETGVFQKVTEGFWSLKEAADELKWIALYGEV